VYAIARSHATDRTALLDGTPLGLLLALALLALVAWVLAAAGIVSTPLARALGAGAAQGSLLACAVAWTMARPAATPDLLPIGVAMTALAGAMAAALIPGGAALYLLAPVWLWRRRARFRSLGFDALPSPGLLLAGLALGSLLGAHLMLTASMTLGYRILAPVPSEIVPWLAYDLGANVLAAECFFRGGLFDRAQRRWSFATAAALSTVACVVRYLVDPLLPRTVEVAAGAAFYVALLSVGNCWLYWRSGRVTPGLIAGCMFFAVYRLLHVVR
jgi:hypothetical protein